MAFIPQYPGLFALYNQPHTLLDFRSRPQVCGCGTCVDLRANGYTNLHHAYDDDDERGQCRYCPPRDPRNLSEAEAEAREHRRRWRRQAFIDTLKAEAEANGGAGEPQLVYELRSLREEISHLSDLVYSVMLDEDCDCDECDEYEDGSDDDCCPNCCPDCASAGPADVKKPEQEEGNGKGKEKEVLQQQQEPEEELIVPTLVHEERTANKDKETVAVKGESEDSSISA